MKITTNSFGNYKPVTNQITRIPKPAELKKDHEIVKITKEEKSFFKDLYPNEKEKIDNYHFYNQNGNMNGVSLGSLFDKRG